MPQMFTRFLAERLNGQTPLTVKEAADGEPVQPGVVYVAPGDFHLTVKKAPGGVVAVLDQEPPQHSHRPAADVLFKSVAATYGPRGLGVVLTGMGQDGLRGSEEITRAGGRVLVQDEASSVVWEMGGLVVNAGLADAVVPLAQVASELQQAAPSVVQAPTIDAAPSRPRGPEADVWRMRIRSRLRTTPSWGRLQPTPSSRGCSSPTRPITSARSKRPS
jgi:two-component system chemotaxis response regulator CheB